MKSYIAVLAIACTFCLLFAGCVTPETPPDAGATVEIIYTNTGQMPMLLATDQIDGYIVWQPFVAVATESGIGKVAAYSQDLPPDRIWEDHTCCALVTRDAMIEENPELVNVIDEVEKKLGDKGRVLVRYSGTQNMCRVMVEGPTDEETERYCNQIVGVVKKKLA